MVRPDLRVSNQHASCGAVGFALPTVGGVNNWVIKRLSLDRADRITPLRRGNLERVYSDRAFTGLALCGLLLRLYVEIRGESLPARSRDWESYHYFIFCILLILAVFMLSVVLTNIGHRIARSQWEPTVIELQREHFEHLKRLVEHSEKVDDRKAAEQQLGQMEKLFWDVESNGDLRQRVDKLQQVFQR